MSPSPVCDADPPAFDASDPLRMLAEAAGYSESEQWWEHLVEQRRTLARKRNRFVPGDPGGDDRAARSRPTRNRPHRHPP